VISDPPTPRLRRDRSVIGDWLFGKQRKVESVKPRRFVLRGPAPFTELMVDPPTREATAGQGVERYGKETNHRSEIRNRTTDDGDQGVNPMRGFVGSGSAGGGLRICISSCRTSTIAASCTSSREVSFFSSAASFSASSRVPSSVWHPDKGADDEHAHLHSARAAKNIRCL